MSFFRESPLCIITIWETCDNCLKNPVEKIVLTPTDEIFQVCEKCLDEACQKILGE